jgi:hypothetical protein
MRAVRRRARCVQPGLIVLLAQQPQSCVLQAASEVRLAPPHRAIAQPAPPAASAFRAPRCRRCVVSPAPRLALGWACVRRAQRARMRTRSGAERARRVLLAFTAPLAQRHQSRRRAIRARLSSARRLTSLRTIARRAQQVPHVQGVSLSPHSASRVPWLLALGLSSVQSAQPAAFRGWKAKLPALHVQRATTAQLARPTHCRAQPASAPIRRWPS